MGICDALVCRKTVKGMCYEFMCRCSVRNEVVDALCRLRHARLCPMNFGSTGSIGGPYMSISMRAGKLQY